MPVNYWKLMVDKPWEEAAMKLVQKANVPVVPIYFHAKNSNLFYKLSKISDTFRTAKLPSEPCCHPRVSFVVCQQWVHDTLCRRNTGLKQKPFSKYPMDLKERDFVLNVEHHFRKRIC